MSCYVREKVLRIPFDKLHKDWFAENFDLNDPDLRCNDDCTFHDDFYDEI